MPESPIEKLFREAADRLWPEEPRLLAQYPVNACGNNYRLDFALPDQKLAIELDGYAYHSSVEQVAKDHQRQRALEDLGWKFVRFGGQEVTRDADACVRIALKRAGLEEKPQREGVSSSPPFGFNYAVGNPSEPTPLWDAFCAAVWPDPALRAWALQQLSTGFCPVPDPSIKVLIGPPGTGKTATLTLLMDLLGQRGHWFAPGWLSDSSAYYRRGIDRLEETWFAVLPDPPRGKRVVAERLKTVTGGGYLTGTGKPFRPTHTLALTAQSKADLPWLGTDAALDRKLIFIPCNGDPETIRSAWRNLQFYENTPQMRDWKHLVSTMDTDNLGQYPRAAQQ